MAGRCQTPRGAAVMRITQPKSPREPQGSAPTRAFLTGRACRGSSPGNRRCHGSKFRSAQVSKSRRTAVRHVPLAILVQAMPRERTCNVIQHTYGLPLTQYDPAT